MPQCSHTHILTYPQLIQTHIPNERTVLLSRESLGKNVCGHFVRSAMRNFDFALFVLFSQEMMPDIDVFCPSMEGRILCERYRALIVGKHFDGIALSMKADFC